MECQSSTNTSISKLNEKSPDEFNNKVMAVETYLKKTKLQKDFNFASCAKDLGVSITEIRPIISYIYENKFRCARCGQRFKTAFDLNVHSETQH